VVRIPGAAHAVWTSNEADVARDMNAFMKLEMRKAIITG
jgi:hypothetical protein